MVVSLLSAPRVATPSSQCGPGPYLSQMLEDKHHPSQPPLFHPPALHSILPPRSFLASRAAIVPPLMQGLTAAVLLLHLTAVLSSLQPSSCISLPMGSHHPSIHLFPPVPLFSPLPPRLAYCPFLLCSGGKSPVCVAWQRAGSYRQILLSFSPTSNFPLPPLFFSLSFLAALRPRLRSSPLPPSPPTSLCRRRSHHLLLITPLSISFSLPASIHTPLSIFLSLPSSPAPSLISSPGWAQEQ